jgi:molecular chaperone GrpE
MKKKIPIKEEELEEDIIDTETPKEHAPPEEASPDWKAKSDEYLNDLKRLQADFENYKKRMENERKDTMRFITTGIISDLVPILDNFNMAVAHVPEDKKSDPWVTGITYIEKQFEEVIAGYGVNVMNVKPGDDFDPTRHEAIGSQQSTDNNEPPSAKATESSN